MGDGHFSPAGIDGVHGHFSPAGIDGVHTCLVHHLYLQG